MGKISKTGQDHCQALPLTCDLSDENGIQQCRKCANCMSKVSSSFPKCVKDTATGYHPGTDLCSNFETLLSCQGHSLGCWYRLMCQSHCVADSWKAVFCGGWDGQKEYNYDKCKAERPSEDSAELMQRGEGKVNASSLDDSLAGKRDCR